MINAVTGDSQTYGTSSDVLAQQFAYQVRQPVYEASNIRETVMSLNQHE